MARIPTVDEVRRWTFDRPSRVVVYTLEVAFGVVLVWWTRETVWPWIFVPFIVGIDYLWISRRILQRELAARAIT